MSTSTGFANGKDICKCSRNVFPGLPFMEKTDVSL